MKNNSDNPLWSEMKGRSTDTNIGVEFYHDGLTKREYFAGLVMQAIISNPNGHSPYLDRVASAAVLAAEILLEELEKTQNND